MYRTPDQIASEFIAEGRRRNITPRGQVIVIATGLVESGLIVYANAKVAASMVLPHDKVGSDGYSVGPLQQQVVMGNNGQWWWGDAATCMDPTLSAGLFYDRLVKLDYNGIDSPGSYAQAVQDSDYPDRYDERFADAQAIYDRLATGAPPVTDPNRPDYNEFAIWCDNNQDRGSTEIDLFLLHTQEGGGGNSAAEDLANFLVSTTGGSNPVSYHYCVSQASDGGVTVVDSVDSNLAAWAVGNSNNRTINLCFAGSASAWTRDQWMQQANAIDVAAYLAVQDCIKYGIPTRVLVPYAAPGGIADHRYCTNFLKDGNNHTDVGGPLQPPWTGFPWDVFAAAVDKYANPSEVPPVTQPPVTPPASDPFVDMLNNGTDRQVLNYIAAQLGPGDPLWPSKGMTLRDKLWSLVTPAAKAARKPKATP